MEEARDSEGDLSSVAEEPTQPVEAPTDGQRSPEQPALSPAGRPRSGSTATPTVRPNHQSTTDCTSNRQHVGPSDNVFERLPGTPPDILPPHLDNPPPYEAHNAAGRQDLSQPVLGNPPRGTSDLPAEPSRPSAIQGGRGSFRARAGIGRTIGAGRAGRGGQRVTPHLSSRDLGLVMEDSDHSVISGRDRCSHPGSQRGGQDLETRGRMIPYASQNNTRRICPVERQDTRSGQDGGVARNVGDRVQVHRVELAVSGLTMPLLMVAALVFAVAWVMRRPT